MGGTYLKVKGQWTYYYRAVDKEENTINFLLTAKREKNAALRFLKKSIGQHGTPSLVNIDQAWTNTAGLKQVNREMKKRIKIRECKYLNISLNKTIDASRG